MLSKIPSYLKNKYSITLIVFIVWLTFFDQNNMLLQFQDKLELWDLDDEKEYYQIEIQKTKSDLEELTTDINSLERFAREKYLMKRDNEEVFVIVEE